LTPSDIEPKAVSKRGRLLRAIPWAVFFIALFLLVSHQLQWTRITVDSTTLILLGILLVCPFADQIRRIRFGEFEAEIDPSEVRKVKQEADKHLDTEGVLGTTAPVIGAVGDELLDLFEKDHALALARLRIDLERALGQLYASSVTGAKQKRPLGLIGMIRILTQSGVLPPQLSYTIRDVIALCNRAIHGEYVRPVDARSILDIGIHVLQHVESAVEAAVIRPKESKVISSSEVDSHRDAKYRVTTIVPLVENPVQNVRILDQEGLDMFLEGYDEHAEFLVGIERVGNGE